MSRRFTWPWGRISPERRMQEIEKIIAKHQANIRILQAQTAEAIRLHKLSIEALQEQKAIVATFLNEDLRKDVMEKAFAMEAAGLNVLGKIEGAQSVQEITDILEQAEKEMLGKNLDIEQEIPTSDIMGLGIFDDLTTDIDDIFGKDKKS